MKPFKTMLKTELKLSLRGMDMPLFTIIMPVVVLVILGALFGDRPAYKGSAYTFLEQSFGALSTISICAGGVMGLPLVISDYRSKRILKRFQVTPVSPGLILVVQLGVYTLYAAASLVLLYLTAFFIFGCRFHGSLLSFLGGFCLVMISMFSIGTLVGGIAPNGKIAGAVASLLYFPMLMLSGATLPYEIMPPALKATADLLPLTHGIKLLKAASLGLPMEQAYLPIIIMIILALLCSLISLKYFRWE